MDPMVLIVGAGPTGLTLACELAARGVSFRLIEATASPQPGSRGKGLQPRTLEVFDQMGIVERVLEHGRMAMPMVMTGSDGQAVPTGDEATAPSPDVPYPASVITPEWRVEEALRTRLAEAGGSVDFGAVFSGFEQVNDGVTVVITKDGATETVRARWLVGCDGGHSLVRKQACIAFEGETREDVRMIVADVHVPELPRTAWQIWRNFEGMVSLCPLPSTELFQYQAGIATGQNPELSITNMQAILQERSGRSDIRLRGPEWASIWRANVRLANRYQEGRVFLAGDAAHIHSPAGGQGMNTGIQDAYNLGWKLAAVASGWSAALLDTYEAERRPVAAHVLALSNALLQQAIEQKGFPTRRDASTMQLGINYRGSVLARDDRDQTALLRAGDRAPDATELRTVDGTRRLFDLTRGGEFTLLNFGEAVAADRLPVFVKELRVVPGQPTRSGEVSDSGGHLRRAYGACDRSLLLIRPDGYLGLISDCGDLTAVFDYLDWSAR